MHPMIETNSADVSLHSENGLIVSFKLKTGEAVQGFVMRQT
ncbi:hypothetical protein LEP1GSC005_4097 [Leptospira santarosai str. ST188]|nr:hypothetical protein LEP1GSC068_0362 [Leptospira sp. Fiocruz LV3954]EMF91000.1 hypothetical protein LEP1GSC005_4097 [Leptospira santarosai str. ST188]EMI64013.1 hypothetical protein LEP1GSC076_2469 [Leptospira sp. Fiocruz LV4135]